MILAYNGTVHICQKCRYNRYKLEFLYILENKFSNQIEEVGTELCYKTIILITTHSHASMTSILEAQEKKK